LSIDGAPCEPEMFNAGGTFMISRRGVVGATLALPALLTGTGARAQGAANWPDRPIRLIVPFPPAGSTDVLSRILAEALRGKLGQPFVIENRPGAGGNIGIDAVAKATPDGYTIGSATIGLFSINQFLYGSMSWDMDRDLVPISLAWEQPNIVVIPSQVPARTLEEFIAWAKAKRGGISFGSPGVGTTAHLSGEIFRNRLGLEAQHVPFRGASQVIPAMLQGDIDLAIDNLPSYASIIQEGRLRALAVTTATRWPTFPDVPTMAEAGMPDFIIASWGGFVAPKGTPEVAVQRINAALRELSQDEALKQRFMQSGAQVLWSTPEGMTARSHKERPMWQEAVRISGARAE
jgi:tripartite-type tricarboxylate transporter receptor subunit TctC